ncbi:hypothetical protein ABRZ04_10470 [Castellaniella ginsengisoli]|uniref:Uncharacterized protein n=1 Tax=Castellaniella ginsengisoli TaxID=546114 RepID=A0AB39CY28_9BURK
MFNLLESTIKAAAGAVSIPVSLAADFVTMGGALTEKDRPYTADACADLVKNVKNVTDPDRK